MNTRIKIFQGTNIDTLEQEVNKFTATHDVFATQHSTAGISWDSTGELWTTIIVFY